jgi:predicted metal-dependent phosphoesterase TrpH
MEPKTILKVAEKIGLDCIAITDHNTIKGGVETKKIKSKIKVFVGSEIKTNLGEIIGYDLHHDIKSDDLFDAIDKIKSQNGLISIPHPFDSLRSGIANEKILINISKKIDFIELNARSFTFFNHKAEYFAKKHRIPIIGGSDAHMIFEIGKAITFMKTIKRIEPSSVSINTSNLYCFYPLIRTKIYKIFKL